MNIKKINSIIITSLLICVTVSCTVYQSGIISAANHSAKDTCQQTAQITAVTSTPTIVPTATYTPKPTSTPVPTPTPMPSNWENGMVFYDEFINGVDLTNWNVANKGNNYNDELEFYKFENVLTEYGVLKLRAKQENFRGHEYTSGLINTLGKLEILYGRIEIKAKHPEGNGLLSAIWLSPVGEDYLPEVDIMEVLGEKPKEIWVVNHYKKNKDKYRSYDSYYVKSIDDFHIYTLVWKENLLEWYIDDRLVHYTNRGIPDEKMYLIINLAIGGVWPVGPDETTSFPSDFEIDYVKVFKEDY